MLIFLVGFMGSGKTSVGKQLARMMNYKFFDTDALIEEREGKTIEQLFEMNGETYFRNCESKIITEFFEMKDAVISCGGGTPCFNNNMALMNQHGITVYLKMEPEALKHRLMNAKKRRPLMLNISEDNMLNEIREKLQTREPVCKQAKIMLNGLDVDLNLLHKSIQYFH